MIKIKNNLILFIIAGLILGLWFTINGEEEKPKDNPTVQQLLDKVKENYHKIQDLKADMVYTIEKKGGWGYPIFKDKDQQETKFYFKAPDKMKHELHTDKVRAVITKNHTEYARRVNGWGFGEVITEETPVKSHTLPWYFLLDPDNLPFYWRLDEIIEKFDCKVTDNPETDIWVIEAVPKASNPEDDYNYPLPTMDDLKIFIDYTKGVITKINRDYSKRELQNFQLINGIWIPTKFVFIQYDDVEQKDVKNSEEIVLSNIQINTGILNSEFEF